MAIKTPISKREDSYERHQQLPVSGKALLPHEWRPFLPRHATDGRLTAVKRNSGLLLSSSMAVSMSYEHAMCCTHGAGAPHPVKGGNHVGRKNKQVELKQWANGFVQVRDKALQLDRNILCIMQRQPFHSVILSHAAHTTEVLPPCITRGST